MKKPWKKGWRFRINVMNIGEKKMFQTTIPNMT
jgi:hypothetical protein